MNAATTNYEEQEFDYVARSRRGDTVSAPQRSKRPEYSSKSRGQAPSRFNGIHRRRSKKIKW